MIGKQHNVQSDSHYHKNKWVKPNIFPYISVHFDEVLIQKMKTETKRRKDRIQTDSSENSNYVSGHRRGFQPSSGTAKEDSKHLRNIGKRIQG